MNPKNCITASELTRYQAGQCTETERGSIEQHLQDCDRCQAHHRLAQQLDQFLSGQNATMNSYKRTRTSESDCLKEDLIYRYLDGALSETDRDKAQEHISNCSLCLDATVSLARFSFAPPTASEQAEIARLSPTPASEQVSRLMTQLQSEAGTKPGLSIRERLKLFFEPAFVSRRWQFGGALALAVLVVGIAGYQGTRYVETTLPTEQAAELLQANYRIYMEETPRLSGGYRSSGISTLMSGNADESNPSYLERALALTQQAMGKAANRSQLLQLEAQIHFIKKDYAAATSRLRAIPPTDGGATVLNDLGVVYFSKADWPQARQFFEEALKVNPNFAEAWYNLALVRAQIGETSGALDALKRYLAVEKDDAWRNAALEFQKKLEALPQSKVE